MREHPDYFKKQEVFDEPEFYIEHLKNKIVFRRCEELGLSIKKSEQLREAMHIDNWDQEKIKEEYNDMFEE